MKEIDFPEEDIVELASVFNEVDFDSFNDELQELINQKNCDIFKDSQE